MRNLTRHGTSNQTDLPPLSYYMTWALKPTTTLTSTTLTP